MERSHLDRLQRWFDGYVRTFDDIGAEDHRNIELKIEHTHKVRAVMMELTRGEGLSEGEACIAEATALLHDVGRFPQYRRWRTFRDSESDNHARLSLEVLREEGVLADLPDAERLMIEEAVRFHNLLEMPARFSSPHSGFIRLIRDADKLDIWRVFMDYFSKPPEQRASAAGLGFADLPEVTPKCVATLAAGRIIRLETARTLNDFKLLQISWAYDLNTSTSYRLLRERGYIERLAATLPDAEGVADAVQQAIHEVARRERQHPHWQGQVL